MHDDQPETGFLQHLQVHIAVAAGKERRPAGAGVDVLRLPRTERDIAVQRVLTEQLAILINKLRCRTDDVFAVDAQGTLGKDPHEVAPAARTDEDPPIVCLQQIEQLEHRLVDQVGPWAIVARVYGCGQKGLHLSFVRFRRGALPGLADTRQECDDGLWNLLGHSLQKFRVLVDDAFIRIFFSQSRISLDLFDQFADQQPGLGRCRLLDPQRAVIIEDRNPLGRRDIFGLFASAESETKSRIAFFVGVSFHDRKFINCSIQFFGIISFL